MPEGQPFRAGRRSHYRFIKFSRESPKGSPPRFVTDVFNLCKDMEVHGKKQDSVIIDLYIKKIGAVCREDFAVATEIRDKIKMIYNSR